ncbi:hypothetical protein MG293_020281 [Ovis ammon polii]|uniref:Uncharacterized protein n=1 Tax=Ovis ammon polii TaxID=230172 RepID=A0AAD4XZY5_OVIAM|nr:hypothetical protein MG293_020281 [Ovis ammon polii]
MEKQEATVEEEEDRETGEKVKENKKPTTQIQEDNQFVIKRQDISFTFSGAKGMDKKFIALEICTLLPTCWFAPYYSLRKRQSALSCGAEMDKDEWCRQFCQLNLELSKWFLPIPTYNGQELDSNADSEKFANPGTKKGKTAVVMGSDEPVKGVAGRLQMMTPQVWSLDEMQEEREQRKVKLKPSMAGANREKILA